MNVFLNLVSTTTTQKTTSLPTTTGSNGTLSVWSNLTSTTTFPPDVSSNVSSNYNVSFVNDNTNNNTDQTGLVFTTGEFVSIVAALAGVIILFICLVVTLIFFLPKYNKYMVK
jgi:hypothetical protein